MIPISGSLINLVENIEVLKIYCSEPYAGTSILLPHDFLSFRAF